MRSDRRRKVRRKEGSLHTYRVRTGIPYYHTREGGEPVWFISSLEATMAHVTLSLYGIEEDLYMASKDEISALKLKRL
jgi:hypothetical protein